MKISICIPTYGRGDIVYENVLKCLESKNDNIEVVVSDNCSDDNTEELLSKIEDTRFKYFKNKYNNGADNLISVLTYATGDYLLLTSDEDTIIIENLEKIMPILENEKPAILKGSASLFGNPYMKHRNGVYHKGFEAISVYDSGCKYMSAYIFCKEIMNKVLDGITGTDINRRFGYSYNFTNLTREMLQYGSLCFREEILTDQFAKGKRCEQTYFDGGECCYSVNMRMKAAYEKLDSLKRIILTERQKYYLCELYLTKDVVRMYIHEFKNAFDKELLNELNNNGDDMIYHYYIDNREVLKKSNTSKDIIKLNNKYIDYIDSIKIFEKPYEMISQKYKDINNQFIQKRNLMQAKFEEEKKRLLDN